MVVGEGRCARIWRYGVEEVGGDVLGEGMSVGDSDVLVVILIVDFVDLRALGVLNSRLDFIKKKGEMLP